MLALEVTSNALALTEKPKPAIDGEAIVRVVLSGICNTDIEIARGYAGFWGTIGHEFVGRVESSPDKSKLGRRVVGEINAGCGNCELCRAGDTRHCVQRSVLGIVGRDGTHAEFLSLPPNNLLVVPDEVSDEQAVLVEPLAAAWGITESIDIKANTRLAVIGDGKLGLLCTRALATRTHQITLIGKHDNKLALASKHGLSTLRLTDTVGMNGEFDVVVEASGSESGFALAVGLLRPRGTLVLKSTFHGKTAIDAAPIVVNEISIVGSRCGRFAPALGLLSSAAVEVRDLISAEFPLAQGIRAMERAAEPGVLKILLRP